MNNILYRQHTGVMKAATISSGVYNRRFPVGAEPATGGVYFRVWAPQAKRVELLVGAADSSASEELEPEAQGYFSGFAPGCAAGDLYRFRLDGREQLLPDPASRFQPEGPFGPSMIVDASQFE
ncbi:MAG TPA: malto-oligosyltrehalose trehalohydrolase, partial [Candidatus Binatia bacterium]|nr:malto-oligosyltrehalose trehalohydrolase [Candidatus Binatia bacterium]